MKPILTLVWGEKTRTRATKGAKKRGKDGRFEEKPGKTVLISPGPGAPLCELSKEAFPVWQRCRENLEALGFWDDADALQLLRYCEAYAEWMRLTVVIRKKGTHQRLVSNKGKVYYQRRPEAGRCEYLERMMLQLEKELGLSRKSRRALLKNKPVGEGEEDEFFRSRG